jgi:hypothetical protein
MSRRERDVDLKDAQMLLVKDMTPEEMKDLLITLVWKSNPTFVQRVLVEKGAIKDIPAFVAGIGKK